VTGEASKNRPSAQRNACYRSRRRRVFSFLNQSRSSAAQQARSPLEIESIQSDGRRRKIGKIGTVGCGQCSRLFAAAATGESSGGVRKE